MPRNCACRRGGKTPHFNTGPNPQYTGLHRKKRTMMDKWVERGDRVHPVVDLTAETSGDEEKRPVKRVKHGGGPDQSFSFNNGSQQRDPDNPYVRKGGVLNLRGQPRYNPAVMELYRVIEELEERLAAEAPGTKTHTEMQRQLTMLGREMERLKDAEKERNNRGGALPPLPSTNETGLRGQPRNDPAIPEVLDQLVEAEDERERLWRELQHEGNVAPGGKEYARLHRLWQATAARIENLRAHSGAAMMNNYTRSTDDRRRISASSDSSEDANQRMDDLQNEMYEAEREADDVFPQGAGLTKRKTRNCVCHHKPLHALLQSGTRKRKRGGAGAEDELAKAVERDRLAEIDRAEAKRLMADAERAKRASLSKGKKGGRSARGGWSDGGTYCR